MITQLAGLLLILLGFTYAGYGIVRFFIGNVQPRPGWILVLSLSFGLGIGIVSLGTILTSLLGLRIGIPVFVLFLLPSLIAHLLWRRRNGRSVRLPDATGVGPNLVGRSLLPTPLSIVILIAAIAVSFIGSVQEPIAEVDAIAHWAFHAKLFLLDRTALPDLLTSGAGGADISHWPPLVPLAQTWVHLGMGGYEDRLVKLLFPLFYLAMLGLFYGTLRRHLPREFSLAITVLLATVPSIVVPFPAGSIASAYADVPMALYVAAISGLLFLWLVERHRGALILAGLFAAAIIWLKREGIAFAAVSTIVVTIFSLQGRKRSIGPLLAWSAFLTASFILQVIYKMGFPGPFSGDPIELGALLSSTGLQRILESAKGVVLEAVHPGRWGFLWILLGLTIFLRIRMIGRRIVMLPLLLLVGQIGIALIGMAVSEFSTARIAALDTRRFLIQVAPIAALCLAVIASVDSKESRGQKASPQ